MTRTKYKQLRRDHPHLKLPAWKSLGLGQLDIKRYHDSAEQFIADRAAFMLQPGVHLDENGFLWMENEGYVVDDEP